MTEDDKTVMFGVPIKDHYIVTERVEGGYLVTHASLTDSDVHYYKKALVKELTGAMKIHKEWFDRIREDGWS